MRSTNRIHPRVAALAFAAALTLSLQALSAAQAQEAGTPATPEPSVTLPSPLARVLRDYESAWQKEDARALAALFAKDGFVLAGGSPPVRGRVAIERHYESSGGPLALRALAYSTEGAVGYILGGYARRSGDPDVGKFTLTLRRGGDGRWLIVSDMDNGNGRPVPTPSAPYQFSDVDTAHGDREFHLLWPEGAPGAVGGEPADKPKITVYRAPAEDANGAAVEARWPPAEKPRMPTRPGSTPQSAERARTIRIARCAS